MNEIQSFSFEDNSKPIVVVMIDTSTGCVFVGGNDSKLSKYDKDFKLLMSQGCEEKIWTGVLVQDNLLIGLKQSLLIIYDKNLLMVKKIRLEDTIKKMI